MTLEPVQFLLRLLQVLLLVPVLADSSQERIRIVGRGFPCKAELLLQETCIHPLGVVRAFHHVPDVNVCLKHAAKENWYANQCVLLKQGFAA
jgi:hypothetical protein